jgi:hypothetical protein
MTYGEQNCLNTFIMNSPYFAYEHFIVVGDPTCLKRDFHKFQLVLKGWRYLGTIMLKTYFLSSTWLHYTKGMNWPRFCGARWS